MPTLDGPCSGCGQHTKSYRRPGKELLCLDCAIAKMSAYQRAMHDGTNPQLAHSIASGRAAGDQIRARSGPIYERWRAGYARGTVRWLDATCPDLNVPADDRAAGAAPGDGPPSPHPYRPTSDEMRWTPEDERPAP